MVKYSRCLIGSFVFCFQSGSLYARRKIYWGYFYREWGQVTLFGDTIRSDPLQLCFVIGCSGWRKGRSYILQGFVNLPFLVWPEEGNPVLAITFV